MNNMIAPEIFWLMATTFLTAAMVIPYAVYRVSKLGGLWQAFLRPLPGDSPFDDEWAHRAYRAHMNAFENIAIFAPAALAVVVTGVGNEFTAAASMIHFLARAIYAPMFYFNVPVWRTAIWFVGLATALYLVIHVLVLALL